jgi:hypothetical protein
MNTRGGEVKAMMPFDKSSCPPVSPAYKRTQSQYDYGKDSNGYKKGNEYVEARVPPPIRQGDRTRSEIEEVELEPG